MFVSDEISFISIGANCITDHQIQQIFHDSKGGIFDSMTITPDALIKVLEKYKEVNNFDFLCNPEMYIEKKVYGLPTATHKYIDGLVFDHEHEMSKNPDKFLSKKNHQINNLISINSKKIFVWSNIQPTLRLTSNKNQIDIKEFYLTKNRYLHISALIGEIFDSACIFIARREYCDGILFKEKNVYMLNPKENFGIEHDDAVRDYPSWKGPPRLFKGILSIN